MGNSKFALTLAAASSVSALVVRDPGCTFTIKTGGSVEYPVGQHNSGQTRAGQSIDATKFTLADGSLTDSQGRGCWWTPPTKVLQCDVQQVPEPGFEIGCDGTVSYNGTTTFWECDAGEKEEVNIYLEYDEYAQGCSEITLTANGCKPGSCETTSSQSSCETVPPSTETVYSTIVETVTAPGTTVTECAPPEIPSGTTETYPQQPPTESYPQQPPPLPTSSFPEISYSASPPPPPPSTSAPQVSYSASPPPPPPSTSIPATSYYNVSLPPPPQPSTSVPKTSYPAQPPPTSYPASSHSASPYPASSPPSIPSSSGGYGPHPSEVVIPGSCPGDITSASQLNLPTLIIPIDSSTPNTAAGTSYFGEVNSSGKSSVFDFNIPQGASGKTCNVVFLFPKKSELETSDFTFSGSGALDFSRLQSPVSLSTSYSTLPGTAQDFGQITVAPGNAYNIASFNCPAGEEVSIKIGVPEGGDTSLRFFEDYNPCPIGLFITTS